ncbi:threonine aldolase, partial [Vibrio parahaemolyticus]|nr:threonine aldolase [Vibrio parahaemolyticus]
MSAHLKQLCHTHLPGNKEDSPAEHFAKMTKWCEVYNVD